jgi:hypothetical protein
MLKRILISILLLISANYIFAQNEIDALRYTYTTYGGTARYMGMSGAFSALGADFSVLSTNPAGIGMFKKSRFVFSASGISTGSTVNYLGENTQDDFFGGKINNFGLVLNLKSYDEDDYGWRSVAFGVGYNYLRNLSNNVRIEGQNNNSSQLDLFMINSDGYHPDELGDIEWMAFDTYATDTISGVEQYTYIHPLFGTYGEQQNRLLTTKGGIGEYVFSIGGNYDDIIQIGATFGIQNIRYSSIMTHTETTDALDFEDFTYIENLETRGTGYNFKFGMIYRPLNFIRAALAFHTPTFYILNDVYSYSMETNWATPDSDGNTKYNSATDEFEYSYEFYSPFRTVAGLAFVLSRVGIISFDYEYVNYANAKFRADDYDFENENRRILENYGAGHNFRAGAEVRLAPVYLRGGFSYYGSPTSTSFEADGSISGYSLGIGLKSQNVYIDLAFNHSARNQNYLLYEYDLNLNESARLNLTDDRISFTFGYKF